MEDLTEHSETSSIWLVFAAFYIVLLSFFIALAANSTLDFKKSKQAAESLNETFSGKGGYITRVDNTGENQARAETNSIAGMLGKTVEKTIGVGAGKFDIRGNVIRLTINEDKIFSGKEKPQITKTGFLENITATLNQDEVKGVKLEYLVVDDGTGTPALKAGLIARKLTELGFQPERLSMGMKEGKPGTIDFYFVTQQPGESR